MSRGKSDVAVLISCDEIFRNFQKFSGRKRVMEIFSDDYSRYN